MRRLARDCQIFNREALLPLFHLRRVAAHLQADEDFDVARIAARLGGGNTPLAKRRRELRPLFFQFAARVRLPGYCTGEDGGLSLQLLSTA
jgi:hypothetical protein